MTDCKTVTLFYLIGAQSNITLLLIYPPPHTDLHNIGRPATTNPRATLVSVALTTEPMIGRRQLYLLRHRTVVMSVLIPRVASLKAQHVYKTHRGSSGMPPGSDLGPIVFLPL